mmetsp:Transcript_23723/g.53465  ORF Transcript_23723/g.53465 Transcript_23723/m.53465 type:complete len:613 (-) Transcript_23723:10-1848(-)
MSEEKDAAVKPLSPGADPENSCRIKTVFRRFGNGDGAIQKEGFATALARICPRDWPEEAVEELWQAMDADGDGNIQYKEFVDFLLTNGDNWDEVRNAARGGFKSAQWVHITKERLSEYYVLDEKGQLGVGTFGCVRSATSRTTQKRRAVKSLQLGKVKRKSLEEEISMMKELDHPNIAQLYEVYEEPLSIHLVLELCTGGELFDFCLEDSVTERQVAHIMRQILAGVRYMHSKLICHRDLKCENYLFNTQGVPIESRIIKIIDFGLACRFTVGGHMTEMMGTVPYMSPQVLNRKYNHQCDIWACGVAMYIVLSGTYPFSPDDADEDDEELVKDRIKMCKYSFPTEIWGVVSEEAKELIRGLLELDAAKRLTAEQAVNHVFLQHNQPKEKVDVPISAKQLQNMRAFCWQNKLKKATLHLIARRLQGDEIVQLQAMFATLDTNKDGILTYEELKAGISRLPPEEIPERLAVREVIDGLDESWTGSINYTEFLAATLDHKVYQEESLCRAAFRVFDRDGNGGIDREELALALHNSSAEIFKTSGVVKSVFLECDTNSDDQIDFSEFMTMMRGVTSTAQSTGCPDLSRSLSEGSPLLGDLRRPSREGPTDGRWPST